MPVLIPPRQRPYVASHPFVVCVAIGIALTGYINIFWPLSPTESVAAAVLPPLMLLFFNGVWAVGGTLIAAGILRGKRRVEAAGMALLASGLLAYYFLIVSVSLPALRSAAFILGLAVGCALRARHLTTHGYVVLDVPTDQKGIR